MYDINKVREDFPILSRTVYGKPLVYFDNGATTQKPLCVLDTMREEYLKCECKCASWSTLDVATGNRLARGGTRNSAEVYQCSLHYGDCLYTWNDGESEPCCFQLH